MRRTTILAPDDILDRLRAQARRRRVSLATVIREALEVKVREHAPKPSIFGISESGHTDTSQKASDRLSSLEGALLSEAVLAKDWLKPEEEAAWRDL